MAIHWLLYSANPSAHAVQFVIEFCQVVQVESHFVQTPLTEISFEFVHALEHTFAEVRTNPELHEVQVEVVDPHVFQLEFQPTQLVPVSIVFPTSQESTQVFVLKSSFMLPFQVTHWVVDPDQVLQFEFH